MAALLRCLNGNPNQIFGPEKNTAIEVGTKWELFNRHLLLTAALFQTNKDNAREAFNVTATHRDAELSLSRQLQATFPASSPARPIMSAASISA